MSLLLSRVVNHLSLSFKMKPRLTTVPAQLITLIHGVVARLKPKRAPREGSRRKKKSPRKGKTTSFTN
jgi:hypothetical protein